MAVKTVGAQGYDAVMALNAVTASTAAVQTANNSSQSFGDALNKASDKVTDKIANNAQADTKTAVKSEQQETQVSEKQTSEENIEETDGMQSDRKVTEDKSVDSDDKSDVKTDNAAQNVEEEEEPIDKMTIEQIADAFMQIIQQLKDLCGVSDAEILAGMKNLDMVPTDLFDANAMTQLLTEIAGEGEVMSLVTNEDLYATLQTLTETAETVSSQLLEDMGLTRDEFDAMLTKLNQTDDAFEEIPMLQEEMTETVNDAVQEEIPVVLVEENEKPKDVKELESQVAQKQFDNVAEAQQKEVVETQAKPQSQSQKSERDTHEQKHNTNDFNGQQGTQNFDSKLDETQAVAETATRYTSESTESILRQLADLVKIVKNENLTQMELQLHPASLGTVNVSLVTKGGAVTAEFTTQNEAVRAAIESQVSQLMANLEEQGVKVEAVEVSVASHQMERELDDNNRDEQSKKEQEEKQRVQGARRNSINFNAFTDDEEMIEELQGADDATRIAMEMMAANGNSMDLMA